MWTYFKPLQGQGWSQRIWNSWLFLIVVKIYTLQRTLNKHRWTNHLEFLSRCTGDASESIWDDFSSMPYFLQSQGHQGCEWNRRTVSKCPGAARPKNTQPHQIAAPGARRGGSQDVRWGPLERKSILQAWKLSCFCPGRNHPSLAQCDRNLLALISEGWGPGRLGIYVKLGKQRLEGRLGPVKDPGGKTTRKVGEDHWTGLALKHREKETFRRKSNGGQLQGSPLFQQ